MERPQRRKSCEEDVCWVCLEGASELSGSLEHPCACPRGVHAKCLARWQLQSAGREEERYCRFCKSELPDWRDILTPKVPAAPPVMAIVYDGKMVRLQVKPGREGMLEFQRQVRRAFNLGKDVELDCVFDCRAPGTGEKVKLRGLESYSAAMHCAAVAAGERIARQKAQLGIGDSGRKNGQGSGGVGSSSAAGASNGGNSSGCSGSSSAGRDASAPSSVAPSSIAQPPRTAPRTSRVGAGTGAGGSDAPEGTLLSSSSSREPPASHRAPTAATTSATADAAATPATLRTPSARSLEYDTAAACHLPSVRTPRYSVGDSCGVPAGLDGRPQIQLHKPAQPPCPQQQQQQQQPSTGWRRNPFMDLLRGLGAVRRVL